MRLPGTKALVAGAFLLLLGTSLALRHFAGVEVAPEPEDLPPTGWWRLALEDVARGPSGEELARQLSLPYAAGSLPPEPGRTGVVTIDPVQALPGYRLYVSGHGPEALLIDREGKPLHRWRLPFRRAFPERPETRETAFFRRAHLEPDGTLLALYQGGGLVRLDPASRVLWRLAVNAFNDFWVSPDGEELLYLDKQTRSLGGETFLEDFVVSLDRQGWEQWRFSILQALDQSSFRELLEPPGPSADRLHSNKIARLAASEVVGSPFREGDLLVSLREIDTVMVLDGRSHTVLWAQRGPYSRQHAPVLFPGGRLLLFDNRGLGNQRSRILEVEVASQRARQVWPPEGMRFFSAQAGDLHPLPNDHLLVVESERGRAYELNRNLEIVWEFRSPHRAGARAEYVASLFDLVYLGASHPGLKALNLLQAP